MCVVVDYCEMGLMKESAVVAFRSVSLREPVYTVQVLSVNNNIGLNLFTLKKYMCCSDRLRGAVQFDAVSGDLFQSSSLS